MWTLEPSFATEPVNGEAGILASGPSLAKNELEKLGKLYFSQKLVFLSF
jgi:hypothetical protein